MRKWFTGALAALLVAGWVWAQTAYNAPGGIPSRLQLQALGLGTPAPSSGATLKAKTGIMLGNQSDPGWDSNASSGFVGGNASGVLLFRGGADIELLQNAYYNGTSMLYATTAAANRVMCVSTGCELDYAGSGTAGTGIAFSQGVQVTPAGAVNVNGVRLQKYASAAILPNGTSCSVSASNPTPTNVASCSHTATGTYQVTFSAAYGAAPMCIATPASAEFVGSQPSLSTMNLLTYTTAGTQADSNITIQLFCYGL